MGEDSDSSSNSDSTMREDSGSDADSYLTSQALLEALEFKQEEVEKPVTTRTPCSWRKPPVLDISGGERRAREEEEAAFPANSLKKSFLVTQEKEEGISKEERLYRESLLKKPVQVENKVDKLENVRRKILPDLTEIPDLIDEGMSIDEYSELEESLWREKIFKKGYKKRSSSSEEEEEETRASTSQNTRPAKKKSKTSRSRNRKKKGSVAFGSIMEESGALEKEPILVIQRLLNETDLNPHHNRLQIPKKQVRKNFLEEEEENILQKERPQTEDKPEMTKSKSKKRGKKTNTKPQKEFIVTELITPSLRKEGIYLRRWEMGKNIMYVLSGNWNKLKKKEKDQIELQPNMVLQVWAYRVTIKDGVNDKVRFALVNLGYVGPHN